MELTVALLKKSTSINVPEEYAIIHNKRLQRVLCMYEINNTQPKSNKQESTRNNTFFYETIQMKLIYVAALRMYK